MSRTTPSQWPSSVVFITFPRYHASVPAPTQTLLTARASPSRALTHTINPLVRIRLVTQPGHPARGQYGLFAHKKIPPRSHIIDYIGEVHCEERDSDYDLSLYRSQDGISAGIDAREMGNEARFINDYRGIQERPNAEFVEYRTAEGELRMSIRSRGGTIGKGNEILVSYGKSWWRSRDVNKTPAS